MIHLVAYASRSVSTAESNYAITNLETLAVVRAVTHFRYYLYGHNVVVITDHAAVKAILGAPNLTEQHAHWWSKLYGNGIKKIEIFHKAGIKHQNADALSRQPVQPAPSDSDICNCEVQAAYISSSENSESNTINSLLCKEPNDNNEDNSFTKAQLKDPSIQLIIQYLSEGVLPTEPQVAAKVVAQAIMYTIVDGILYYNGQKGDSPRAVVPCNLQQSMMEEYHGGIMTVHFSGPKVYKVMSRQWWWQSMYQDIIMVVLNVLLSLAQGGDSYHHYNLFLWTILFG